MRPSQPGRLRRAAQAARVAWQRPDGGAASAGGSAEPPAPVVRGLVEDVTTKVLAGWVSVAESAPPTRVDLFLGPLKLSSSYATPGGAMSGIHVDADGAVTLPSARPEGGSTWRRNYVRGPKGDRRNSRDQIRTFSFRIGGIWDYVQRGTRITVRVDGEPLPINRHGMFLRPSRNGSHRVPDLRVLLDQGYVLTQMGRIELSKRLDTAWQDQAMRLYTSVRKVLADEYAYDAFLIYGTLLGAVREGGYISHDADFDAAYVSRFHTGQEAAAELEQIALTLVRHGFGVDLRARLLHIHDPDDPDFHIDLFHLYFEDGRLRFPFGIAGTTIIRDQDWRGTKEIDFPGGRALVPVDAEEMVAHLYGDDWRQPKPGFNWSIDRTDQAEDGQLSREQRTRVYWAGFYAKHGYSDGSTFFEFVNARADTPGTVVDIGCGDGRDARAFAAAGRRVLGLDQSVVGIEHAAQAAASAGLGSATFRVCDVTEVGEFGAALDSVHTGSDQPVLFYLRFFLHAIPEEAQEALLAAIDTHARPGDYFAAEFRTDKDAKSRKVHGRHYRRFQSASQFRADLEQRFGFDVLFDTESAGLSPYGEEDPVLYRIVARRRGT
ncbi:MAG: methyltransferase domain-containing protein [Nocardioidaceae bacterium]